MRDAGSPFCSETHQSTDDTAITTCMIGCSLASKSLERKQAQGRALPLLRVNCCCMYSVQLYSSTVVQSEEALFFSKTCARRDYKKNVLCSQGVPQVFQAKYELVHIYSYDVYTSSQSSQQSAAVSVWALLGFITMAYPVVNTALNKIIVSIYVSIATAQVTPSVCLLLVDMPACLCLHTVVQRYPPLYPPRLVFALFVATFQTDKKKKRRTESLAEALFWRRTNCRTAHRYIRKPCFAVCSHDTPQTRTRLRP